MYGGQICDRDGLGEAGAPRGVEVVHDRVVGGLLIRLGIRHERGAGRLLAKLGIRVRERGRLLDHQRCVVVRRELGSNSVEHRRERMARCDQTTAARLSHHVGDRNRRITRGHWKRLFKMATRQSVGVDRSVVVTYDETSIDDTHRERVVKDRVAVGEDSDDRVVRALTLRTDGMRDALARAIKL